MTPNKVRRLTPFIKVKTERSAPPQCEEGSPSQSSLDNVVIARLLPTTELTAPGDQAPSNSLDLLGDSTGSSLIWAKFHTLLEIMNVHSLTVCCALHLRDDANPMCGPTITPRSSGRTDSQNPTSYSRGHVVNYNIHMDLRSPSEGFKCRAFSAIVDDFKQLTDLFEARFSNQQQCPITTASLMCIRQGPNEPLQEYMARFNHEARKVSYLLTEVYMPPLMQGITNNKIT
ncbi:hypothetical protein ACLOJK_038935 [Asimina triloba]